MISDQTETILRRLLVDQPTYRPIPAILEKLKNVRFICFVGATCVGKTTLMDALAAFAPNRYGKTRNFTSREPRVDDDTKRYYYYKHSDKGLAPVLRRIAKHENLQHNINPYTLAMYGSELADYPHPYNLGDIFSSSIDSFRQLGFGELRIFSVVTDPVEWARRLEERFPTGHPSRPARIQEAIDSLEWSLGQTASDHSWIINPVDDIQTAVRAIGAIIDGEEPTYQPEVRRLAEQCLRRAKEFAS